MKGKVKWFNDKKGFGFVMIESKEYFVHWLSIVTASDREEKTLSAGEAVEFDLLKTDKGVQAINVIRLKP